MKIEKISYNKIKVTVTTLDMIKWGVSLDNFVQDTPEARELFWTLIKRAEYETGFSFENSKLMVEAIPHKYDGIVLVVTKVEDEINDLSQFARKSKVRAKTPKRRSYYEIFEFTDIENIIECSKQTGNMITDLYSCGGKYYLIVYGDEDSCAALNEFGDKVHKDEFTFARIREHGKLIAQRNAINIIKSVFNTKKSKGEV